MRELKIWLFTKRKFFTLAPPTRICNPRSHKYNTYKTMQIGYVKP